MSSRYEPPDWDDTSYSEGESYYTDDDGSPVLPEDGDYGYASRVPPFEPPVEEETGYDFSVLLADLQERFARIDPVFVYALAMALSLGLTPLAVSAPHDRYALLWALLALVSAAHMVAGGEPRLTRSRFIDLVWGGVFGLIVGVPLLLVGPQTLYEVSQRKIFGGLPNGVVFQTLVFVMPIAETVFFRGMMQAERSVIFTALLASGWSLLLFFPSMGIDLRIQPAVPVIVGTFIVMLNLLYSYVRRRNGVAAAWVCQVIAGLCWLLVPRLFP